MFAYLWPIALVVLSNVFYHVCTKDSPAGMHPMATLTVTYLVAAAASAVGYFLMNRGGNLLQEMRSFNWSPIVLGVVIIGLEAGWIYAYKAGWQVSVGSVVASAALAVVLLAVGALFYHEALTWNKLVGIAICLVGLVFINL